MDYGTIQLAIESGIIDFTTIQEQVEVMKKRAYLENHKYKIFKDSLGRWSTYLPATETNPERTQVRKKDKQELEEIIIKFYKDQEERHSVKNVFELWLQSKLDYGEITKQSYDKYTNLFIKLFNPIQLTDIGKITEFQLEDFIKRTIKEQELTAKGWSDMRILINGIWKYAKKNKWTKISITCFMGDLEISRKAFKRTHKPDDEEVFTEDEVKRITEYIEKHKTLVGLGVLLAMKTGMRCGEISTLKLSDVDFEQSIIHVQRTEIRYKLDGKNVYDVRESTKGRDGERTVVVTGSAKDVLRQIRNLNPFGQYLFEHDGKRVLGKTFTRRLYDICDKLEIPKRSLHKCRKTYATTLINDNVDLAVVAKQLGHAQTETTIRNYYKNNKSADEIRVMLDMVQNL